MAVVDSDQIKVVIRVRPLLQKEQQTGLDARWVVKDEKGISQQDQPHLPPYIFDAVYDRGCTTWDLYSDVIAPIVDAAMNGYHGTVFAYGQSGSGKTYTMSGDKMTPGVVSQAMSDIFDFIEKKPSHEFLMRASYMEIYNEKIYDLLKKEDVHLKVQETPDHQINVVGLEELMVQNCQQVLGVIEKGEAKRTFAQTKQNDRSSRSHCIFRIIIESRPRNEEDTAVMVSHLNFVDLAGSEKAGDNTGDRFREGCSINKSLFTLSNVISKLSDGVGNQFIGFRDSKLTRILQNALGGNSKTVIIATVNPTTIDESHSTLKFATRAKTIKNKPHVNEVLSEAAMLKKYRNQISQLKKMVKDMGVSDLLTAKEDLAKQLEEKKQLIAQLTEQIVVSSVSDSKGVLKKKTRRETWCGPKLQRSHLFPALPSVMDFSSVIREETTFDMAQAAALDLPMTTISAVNNEARAGAFLRRSEELVLSQSLLADGDPAESQEREVTRLEKVIAQMEYEQAEALEALEHRLVKERELGDEARAREAVEVEKVKTLEAQIQRLETDHRQDLEGLGEAIGQMERETGAGGGEVQRLRESLKEMEFAAAVERDQQDEQHRGLASDHLEEVQRLTGDLQRLTAEVLRLEFDLNVKLEENKSLQTSQWHADEEVKRLTQELSHLCNKRYDISLEDWQNLEAQKTSLELEVKQLAASLQEREKDIVGLKKDLEGQDPYIARLEQQLEMLIGAGNGQLGSGAGSKRRSGIPVLMKGENSDNSATPESKQPELRQPEPTDLPSVTSVDCATSTEDLPAESKSMVDTSMLTEDLEEVSPRLQPLPASDTEGTVSPDTDSCDRSQLSPEPTPSLPALTSSDAEGFATDSCDVSQLSAESSPGRLALPASEGFASPDTDSCDVSQLSAEASTSLPALIASDAERTASPESRGSQASPGASLSTISTSLTSLPESEVASPDGHAVHFPPQDGLSNLQLAAASPEAVRSAPSEVTVEPGLEAAAVLALSTSEDVFSGVGQDNAGGQEGGAASSSQSPEVMAHSSDTCSSQATRLKRRSDGIAALPLDMDAEMMSSLRRREEDLEQVSRDNARMTEMLTQASAEIVRYKEVMEALEQADAERMDELAEVPKLRSVLKRRDMEIERLETLTARLKEELTQQAFNSSTSSLSCSFSSPRRKSAMLKEREAEVWKLKDQLVRQAKNLEDVEQEKLALEDMMVDLQNPGSNTDQGNTTLGSEVDASASPASSRPGQEVNESLEEEGEEAREGEEQHQQQVTVTAKELEAVQRMLLDKDSLIARLKAELQDKDQEMDQMFDGQMLIPSDMIQTHLQQAEQQSQQISDLTEQLAAREEALTKLKARDQLRQSHSSSSQEDNSSFQEQLIMDKMTLEEALNDKTQELTQALDQNTDLLHQLDEKRGLLNELRQQQEDKMEALLEAQEQLVALQRKSQEAQLAEGAGDKNVSQCGQEGPAPEQSSPEEEQDSFEISFKTTVTERTSSAGFEVASSTLASTPEGSQEITELQNGEQETLTKKEQQTHSLDEVLQEEGEETFGVASDGESLKQDNLAAPSVETNLELDALKEEKAELERRLQEAVAVHEEKEILESKVKELLAVVEEKSSLISQLRKSLEETGSGSDTEPTQNGDSVDPEPVVGSASSPPKPEKGEAETSTTEEDVASLQARLAHLSGVEQRLEHNIQQLEQSREEKAALDARVQELAEQLEELSAQAGTAVVNGQVTSLQSQKEALDGQVSHVSSQVQSLQSQLQEQQQPKADDDAVREAQLASKEGGARDVVGDLVALQTEVTAKDLKVTELQTEVTAKELKVTELQTEVTAKDLKVTELQTEVTAKDLQVTQLQTEVAAKDLKATELQTEVTTKDLKVTELQTEVTAKDLQVTELQTEVTAKDLQVTELLAEVDSLQSQTQLLQSDSASTTALEKEAAALREECSSLKSLVQQSEHKEEQLASSGRQRQEMETQVLGLTGKLEELNCALEQMQADREEMTSELSWQTKACEELQSRIGELEAELGEQKQEADMLVQELEKAQKLQEGSEQCQRVVEETLQEVQGQNAKLEADKQTLASERDHLELKEEAACKEQERLRLELKVTADQLEGRISALQLEAQAAVQRKEVLEAALADKESAQHMGELLHDKLSQDLHQSQAEVGAMKTSLSQLQADLQRAENKMVALERAREAAEGERDALQAARAGLETERAQLKSALLTAQGQLRQAVGQREKEDESLTALKARLALAVQERQLAEQQLDQLHQQADASGSKVARLQQELEAARAQGQRLTQHVLTLESQGRQAEQQCAHTRDLLSQAQQARENAESQCSNLQEELSKKVEVIEQLQKDLEASKTNAADSSESSVDRAGVRMVPLLEVKKQKFVLKGEIKYLREELKFTKETIEMLRNVLAETEAKLGKYENEDGEVEDKKVEALELSAKAKVLEMHSMKLQHQELVTKLQKKLSNAEDTVTYKDDVISKLKGEIRRIRSEEVSFCAPAKAVVSETVVEERNISSNSGIIDRFTVTLLEADKFKLQKELKKTQERLKAREAELHWAKVTLAKVKGSTSPQPSGSTSPEPSSARTLASDVGGGEGGVCGGGRKSVPAAQLDVSAASRTRSPRHRSTAVAGQRSPLAQRLGTSVDGSVADPALLSNSSLRLGERSLFSDTISSGGTSVDMKRDRPVLPSAIDKENTPLGTDVLALHKTTTPKPDFEADGDSPLQIDPEFWKKPQRPARSLYKPSSKGLLGKSAVAGSDQCKTQ